MEDFEVMVPKVDGQNAFASVNDDAWFPLSANQRNLWFLYKLQPELQGNYNISFFARLLGAVDLDLLDKAIAELMKRHAMLRTRFRDVGEEPEQRSERFARLQLQVVDVYGVKSADLDSMVKEDSVRPFDLTVAPLFRVGIYRVNAQESVIVLTFNHLVVDGWSLWRLIEELGVILEGIGGAAPLRPVVSCGSESKPSYFDYVCWQRDWINGDGGSKQFSYWKELLADEVPSLNLPVRTPRAAFPAKHRDAIYFGLDMELSMKLNNFSDRCNSSIYVVLLAAYFILLRRITGQDDFNVGSPMPARRGKKWSDVTGAFFNQVVLQANFDPDLTVGELLRRVRSRVRRAMENQDFPFFELVERLNPHREESRSPFFQTMFVFQNPRGFGDALNILVGDDEIAPVHWGGLHLVHFCHPPIAGAAALDLVLEAVKWGEKIGFILDFDPLLFERSTLEQWMGHWRHLLEAMVAEGAEDQVVDRLPLLSEAELHQVLTQWNATAEDYPRDACVHELFERQVARDPSAIAVVQGEVSLTYGELNARANRLAHYLRELGVCPDDRVAICVQRSVEMVLALLAVLKAGGAYVPLDPAYPPERLAYMLADCGAVAVLTQTASRSLIEESAASAVIVDLHVDAERWAQLPDSNPDRNAIGLATRHLAYVIYTSGSTGTPKGVMIEHRGCVNLYHHYALGYLRQGEKVLVVSSFSFDLTLKNIFSPLFVGSTVVLAPAVVMVGSSILSLLESSGAALINCAPSQLYGVFDECGSGNKEILLDQLRYIVLGGEPIKGDRLSAWISGNEKYVFVNSYGPAEITDVAVDGVIKDLFASETMPIGRPIANTRIYILDAHDAPVPVGVVGELYIGGDGVGRGYLNRDDLTAERFLTDPFSADPAARMYRTGDLGRWRADGTIEFVGRNDHQVKIRGFRIELGEIEARLSAHADVRECVVVALEDATGTGKWLVAYWVGAEEVTSEHLGAETLRSWLSDVLPDYMVPAAYVRLDRLPLTPNGKLDRKALPAPDGSAYAAHAYEAPQGNIEQTIATIWSDLLGLENIGRHDNFFALGGHSLLTVRVASCLRQQLDIEIGVADLFAHATLQQLAARVASSSSAVLPPIVPLEPDASRVLSFAQQRLWFLSQFEGVSQAYHISGGLRLRGALDTQALQRALDRIVARHASLRTTFGLVDGQALQQIAAEDSGFQLIVHDLRELVEREGALERLLADEAKAPFALERGPLIRGRLVQLADDESVLFVTMHHIVSDGWSLGILIDELSVLYRAFARGEADPLTPLPIQYADYASWQRQWLTGEVLDQQASYWRETLSGAPVLLELPTDRPRPARQDHAGATLEVVVGPQQAQALKALSQRHGLTLYMTLIASWALLLSRLSGQEDVVIGSPVANRGRSETEGLIGFFVNTLALRVELSGSPTLAQLLASVKARALQAQAHQDIPFEQVVELLQPPRSLAHAPLFQVMLAWQNTPHGELDLGEIETSEVGVAQTSAQFDLSLSLAESEEGIVGSLTYATALFEHSTLERWMGHWRHLLAAMLAEGAEDQAVDRLPLLDEVERYQVLTQWNATAEDYPRDACIHELFERQVARDPSAIAVVQGEVSLTYGELNARANRLAHYLRELGVCPDDRVAICVQRSVEMVVALLAVLKAGGAYVPLDPAYPPERLAYMQSDCGAVAVLTDAASRYLVEDSAATAVIVDLQADGELWEHLPDSNPDRHANGLTARHLAYVIYTSGSTGAPKGAMNEHRGLVNMACAQKKILFLNSNSRILQFASFSFDACTFEIMMAICWGGALFIPFNNEIMVGDDFFEIIKKKEITNATLPPTVLPTVSNVEELVSLQTVVVAGEALPAAMVKRWGEGRRLINAYGPTETTVCVSVHECDANATGAPPIGRPIANVRIYILDAHGAPVSIGVVGELYIGGDGVGRGYLNRDDLTTERFLIDPFSADQTARMYRSGDLGRWRADGTIEFVGRNDHQVKIRGFRIELGEIEARLSAHADVRECVVVALDAAAGSDRRLVAYWVGAEDVDAQRLRSWLSDVLPDYMVPAAYVQLDKLPLTANGKLDRKALPAPDGAAYAAHAYEAPQGEIEQAIAVIWRDLLGLETIGRHDNFFALGGHSLLVVRVASRLRQDLGAEIGVAELFAHATLQQLAACVASSSGAILSPIMPLAPDAPRVLSFAQQRLWFLSQFEGVSQAYHISGGLRLRGPLERHALQRALDRIVARHASLRTTFALIDGQALQQVAAEDSGFHLIAHDLREVPEHEAVLERLLAEEAQTPFALDRGPLIRGVLVQLAHDEHVLFVTMHHIVSDGWSIGILTNELSALYRAFARGEADPLPPLPIQYADYASWQRQWLVGEVLQQQATYWRETLSGAPVLLELPTDRPRPARQDHAGAALEVVVGPQQAQALKELSQRHGLTMYMTLLASCAMLLSRLSGQDDVVIGSPVANRGRSETEGLIGFFVNTLALRVELSGSPTLTQLLASVKERALQAQTHQDIPFEQVVELVQPPRSLAHAPLFQVMFAWQNTPQGVLNLGELDASGLGAAQTSVQFDLSLSLEESKDGIVGSLTYATALFEHATLERWIGHWQHLLAAMVAEDADDRAVDRLPILGEAERHQVLIQWNATAADYPRDACVHELFEAQVARDPTAIAVVQGETSLTYGELNARANRLAHYLRESGVRPDERVAICVQRSVEMVVALLAVLKAGGAYVPLDPAYPPERLAYMRADCGALTVLTDTASRHLVEDSGNSTVIVDLQVDVTRWEHLPDSNPDRHASGLTACHLAYVIYTSGSTGAPKGVMIEHRNLCNYALDAVTLFGVTQSDLVLQQNSISFDLSVEEIFPALLGGAALILAPTIFGAVDYGCGEISSSPRVTVVHLTMAHWHSLVGTWKQSPELARVQLQGVRLLNVTGDAISPQKLREWHALRPRNIEVVNTYGPTETTVSCTAEHLTQDAECDSAVTIGQPLANTRIYILDINSAPVPIGVVGELYIGGDGVGRGYLNRDDLTAERFLTDPFSDNPTARMYRTGDLGRWRADGTIEFVGRNDHQVKISGFRIELGEIEARLSAHADVRECVVVALEDATGTGKRLVAYWVGAEEVTSEHLGAETLRSWLSDVLPDYMVPAAYVRLDRLPLTPNGKLDRKALPVPDAAAYAAHAYEAPQGQIEQTIAAIWRELLGLENIGRHDNFFALGGHSLLGVQLISRIRSALGLELPLATLFAQPRLVELAQALDCANSSTLPAIVPADRNAALPLSYAQQRLWFLAQFDSRAAQAYTLAGGVDLHGALNLPALQQALDRIVARHEALRTCFVTDDDGATQSIAPADVGFALTCADLRNTPDAQVAAQDHAEQETNTPFELSRAPLIRGRLLQLAEQQHRLLVTMHHIISDGWSIGILLRELGALYAAFVQGQPDPLPPLPIQYADYSLWQRRVLDGPMLQRQLGFWREHLHGAPALLELPTDHPRPAVQDYRGNHVDITLDTELTDALNHLSQRHGTTVFMTVLAGWAVLLSRLSGQDQVVIGAPVANRTRSELEALIGFFVNAQALHIDLRGAPTVADLLAQVRSTALAAQDHQDVPFEKVIEALNPERSLSAQPVFQVVLTWQNVPEAELVLPDIRLQPLSAQAGDAKFDLEFSLLEQQDRIVGSLGYAKALFERSTIERHLAQFVTLLRGMVADDYARVAQLPLLPTDERAQLQRFTVTESTSLPPATCIHHLFDAQVRRTPDAIAVSEGQRTLRYAELDARANRLAQRLRRSGVGLESRVALYLPRSIEQVVAVLATLKAGAAYVPLDPELPSERLAFLLEDSRPRAVLTCTDLQDHLPASRAMLRVSVLTLDDIADTQHDDPGAPNVPGLCPDNLAYVIYTSGSTGQPKGTLLTHAGAAHYLQWAVATYRPTPSAVVSSSLSFDATLTSLLAPLLCGAQVELLPDHDTLDALRQRLCDPTPLGLVKLTPAHLEVLGQQLADHPTPLNSAVMVIGGEALPPATLARWQALAPHTRLINEYGPTETVVGCSVHTTTADDAHASNGRVPIGQPIAHLRLYVLDAYGQHAPMGVAGELHIAGPQLARGYLGRADLTAERFVPDPFADVPGARMYRSGDIACWRADGTLEYLGRNDDQVKLRGFRIELGEIAAALRACAGVQDAAVLLREDNPGEPRLVAYVVGHVDGAALSSEALRPQLGVCLPDYMLPTAYVQLETLPLTANGKLDRKALPAPDAAAYAARAYEAPQGAIEQAIAAIWGDLLGLETIGRHDNFFALGGHSLLAVRVASRLRQELGVEIGVAELFAHATLQRLAACVASSSAAVLPPILPLAPDAPRVLSFAQQRLWFLSQFEGVSQAYHISGGLRLRGALDTQALQRTLDRIVARHASLRTTFALVDGQALQQVAAEDCGFQLIAHDLRDVPEREAKLEWLLAEEAQAPFALEHGPLIRGVLVRLADEESVLFVTMHHIVSDGWSMGILINELSVLYRAFARGEADPLAPLPIQYADYASWQRRWLEGEVLQRQVAYWREALSGAPVLLELPTDRPRPPRQDHAGATLEMVVEPQQAQALKELSQRHGLTMYMTLLASWALLLSRLSGQDDVVIGSPVANRGRSETEGLIGFFVNTLALRVEVSGSPTLAQLLASVKERALQAQAHQDIPFEQVVELVQPPRSLAHAPLFQVMFAWQNTPQGELDLGELEVSGLGATQTSAQFDLSLSLEENTDGIVGSLTYATALFEHATLERWMGHWRHLLAAMVAEGAEDMAVDRLPLLDEAERHQVLTEWNATAADYPRDACVHELFEAQVVRDPSAIAVVQGEVSLTYGELNARANRLAHYLRGLGVRPDDRVAICVQRSVEMVVAMLAVLKAGGAYVPLDPTYPVERLAYMLEDSAPVAVLAQTSTLNLLSAGSAPIVNLDESYWHAQSVANLSIDGLTSAHLAYLIYTSGSTGRPKGVMVEHSNTVNLLTWAQRSFEASVLAKTLFSTSLNFDLSVYECFAPLMCGGAIEVVDNLLALQTDQHDVTLINTTPSALKGWLESGGQGEGVHTVNVCGEVLKRQVVEDLFAKTQVERLCNLYGPSETTTYSSWVSMARQDGFVEHIGKPLANTQFYLLDKYRQPVPVGVMGEIYIGGAGVTRGYLNRDDLTAERFLTDPFSTDPTARMYRTGDLGRWRADGTIEFLGRNDHQVKIRGFRIELGEIEARLSAHADVRECVVVALEDVAGTDKRLVAYWVSADGVTSEHLGAEVLRNWLSDVLPDYMVPAAYVQLDRLPLTPNGKLDRKALPAPDAAAYAAVAYEAPQGNIEQTIATIWGDLLGLETIGRHDDFFALGGHSLLAVRVASRLRQELAAEIGVAELFAHSTLQQLAACVTSSSAAVLPPIKPMEPDAPRLLSFAQQRLWFLSQFEGVSQAYHISGGLRLRGALETQALQRALDRIVARHASLRTTFALIDGQALQQIAVEDIGFHLIVHDLCDVQDRETALERLLAEEAQAPFALERGPLIRGVLVQLAHDEHVLFVTMHHIVSDGWSMGILINELSVLYRVFAYGEADPLPPLPIQYADYANWQRQWLAGEVLQQQANYWRETLSGAPVLLELPTDRSRPFRQDHAGATLEVVVGQRQAQALKTLSQRHGLTMYMTLLASWAMLLSRLSGQDDVVIGSPVANRGRSETEGLIGFFVNTLALRVKLSGSPTLAQLLASVKERALQAQVHQDIPFEQVVELVQPPRSLAHTPLFQVMFAWQNTPQGKLDIGELQASGLGTAQTSAQFDLSLSLAESEAGIIGSLTYATALFEHATLERWMGHWQHLLDAMVAEDAEDQVVDRLPLLGEAERKQMLMEWNTTAADYPRDACVHELFESQVERTPSAIAVVQGEVSLTYAELNARANRLAHYLGELGVRPGDRVAICVQRSVEIVVALLAVLKAGGAYVPLDPAYPLERLTYILADCDAVRVLAVRDTILPEPLEVLRVNIDDAAVNAVESDNPGLRPHGSTSAYVMYTSGSTGLPKGVEIPHRGINRLVLNNGYLSFHPSDRIAFAANPSFDATTLEVWGALLNGARLVVIEADVLLSPVRLAEVIECEGISILLLAAGLFHQCADKMKEGFCHLRYLLAGGDALDPSVVAKVLAGDSPQHFLNCYGPTEITTIAATYEVVEIDDDLRSLPIGRPIANTQIYILDGYGAPVPIGVVGELYIGGDGVARGYLNRDELTAERFLADPFNGDPTARMYRSGDLGRWRADGIIEFVGRNDHQVKVRGFRIELGEIEARLNAHVDVRECVVVALEDATGTDKRLVAYWVGAEGIDAQTLRSWLSDALPDYMVPAAYVQLDRLPLTPNGKLDRKALPAPDGSAYAAHAYEAPQGAIEQSIAEIWRDLLGLEKIGRHDNFFALGGHSLLAVTLTERMRKHGLQADLRTLFATPTLAALAAASGAVSVSVPPNAIALDSAVITPEMLPLVALTQQQIDVIVTMTSGGCGNIQDIYPLAPLQEGIFFHHLLQRKGDAYLLPNLIAFDSRSRLDKFVDALQHVIDRHDILRTAVVWEGLAAPVQVVWRRASLVIEEVCLEQADGDVAAQLQSRFDPRHWRMDVRQAPLMRGFVAHDPASGRWLMQLLSHHLALDHTTLEIVLEEVKRHMFGEADSLPAPLPFRNFVAQALLGVSREEHEAYFRSMFGDVDEPCAPFGLLDVQGDGSDVEQVRLELPDRLSAMLRSQARELGVSVASLFHLAWAQVVARATGHARVVFGTVLFGRMQGGAGADRALGVFINTLPLRIEIDGSSVVESVREVQQGLAALLRHEHAPLSLVQRCSGVPAPAPLFTSLLNYRHSGHAEDDAAAMAWEGVQTLSSQERTNYPLGVSVDDVGSGFVVEVQSQRPQAPERICVFLVKALEGLADALAHAPETAVRALDVLPEAERHQVLTQWNETAADYPCDVCVHELFEAQVLRDPSAVAVVHGEASLTYSELNAQANRLAHYLRELGVRPDERVAICVQRSVEMVVALLAVLKAGGAYVPLDPAYPSERLVYMQADCGAVAVLTDAPSRSLVEDSAAAAVIVDLQADRERWGHLPDSNPDRHANGLTARHLVYVIYTSGSTGTPKGVMIEHRHLCNHVLWQGALFGFSSEDRVLQRTSTSFDASGWEIWTTLSYGASIILTSAEDAKNVEAMVRIINEMGVTIVQLVPSILLAIFEYFQDNIPFRCRYLFCGGERISSFLAFRAQKMVSDGVINLYGPTEATIDATAFKYEGASCVGTTPIGRPIANTRIYILDGQGAPVPIGVVGELYIGGDGVGRGYLNRDDLTAERFLADPFNIDPTARMYRTGDLGRWRVDGMIEFVGRNDHQVKLRGFRVELGEIEARLSVHADVRECVVVALEDAAGSDKRLVAYWVGAEGVDAADLRSWLSDVLPDYMVPAAYVQLDRLPLNPNGKLDRKALPAPDSTAYAARAYEAPQGAIEQTIAAIWSDLLEPETIGRHDNFFALGGHSLLAVQVVSRLKQAGVEISMGDLFAHPDIISLAAHFQKGECEDARDGLIPFREEGSEPPLFFIYDISGHAMYGMEIEKFLRAGIPVYGVEYPEGSSVHSMQGMAAQAIERIRRVQPSGPYRLAGWSFGGVVAYEMANQLIKADMQVEFLGLLDTMNFSSDVRLKEMIASFSGVEGGDVIRRVLSVESVGMENETEEFNEIVNFCKQMFLSPEQMKETEQMMQSEILDYTMCAEFMKSAIEYDVPSIPIRVHLFEASHAAMVRPLQQGPLQSWQGILPKDSICHIQVPGTHQSMVKPPYVEILSVALAEAIRNA